MNYPPKQKKKRVALITSVIDNRRDKGTALVARRILERLPAFTDTYEFTFIHHGAATDPLYATATEVVMPNTRIPFAKHFFQELFFWMHHWYREPAFDIVHYLTPRVWPSYLFAHGRSIIVTAHEAGVMLDLHKPTLADRVFRITNRFLHWRMHRVIAVSAFGKKEIEDLFHLSAERVVSIYNGIDTPFYTKNDAKDAAYLERTYGIKGPYILSVGRMDPHKNIHRLIEALAPIAEGNPNITLVLVGGRHLPAYSAKVDSVINALRLEDRVHIAPFITAEDLPHVYAHAQCVVYPSLHEGFGLPVLEAMASGTPIAVSNRTALPEIAGGAALLFDPENVQEITASIQRLLEEPAARSDLIEKGKKRLEVFSWDTTVRQVVALYEELARPTTTYPSA